MADATATGAANAGAEKQTATDAAKSGEDLQKKFDAQAKAQREAYEAEKTKLLSQLEAEKKAFESELAKERERAMKAEKAITEAEQRRIAKLEERAKSLPEAAQKLAGIAKDKGSEAYEEAIANAEALVSAGKPKVQGGNLDGSLDSVKAAQQAELAKLPDAEKLIRAREIDARNPKK